MGNIEYNYMKSGDIMMMNIKELDDEFTRVLEYTQKYRKDNMGIQMLVYVNLIMGVTQHKRKELDEAIKKMIPRNNKYYNTDVSFVFN